MTNSMDDIAENAEVFFIIGSNTTEQHPVFGTKLRRAIQQRGTKLIVADPRRIDITDLATVHLQQKAGTDTALINGLMYLIYEKGYEDKDFIAERTVGFDAYREVLKDYPPEKVSKITGVPVELLHEAAEIMGTHKPMATMWAMGITQHIKGVRNVMALANLQMTLGNMGIPGGGTNPLRGQNNVQGACDLGGLPNVYPGYQKVTDDAVQEKFLEAWGATANLSVGKTLTEMIPDVLEGKTNALYILGEDPVMSDPDTNHIRANLDACDFVVLQEIFPSETAVYADVLLPGASFAEKTGTFTNTERRIQMVRQAVQPVGDSLPDWQITAALAKRMIALDPNLLAASGQFSGWDYEDTAEIMAEIAELTPQYAGVTHERLENGERLQWPVRDAEHTGTPILHVGRFALGMGRFMPIEHIPPAESPDDEYPFIMSTGRVLYHWHGGQMTRRVEGIMEAYGESLVEINPVDADTLGLNGDSRIRISSRRGSIESKAIITDRVPPGMVYTNFHFPESSANVLTQAVLDPVAKIPEFKVTAVSVEKVD
ncbi:MAG: molybdopterin-dependent oxidoreductase [Anaerolineae bacterium]|jgi:predicted molibdopterin-dependent oxidoreductase YjgC|nr:molybdopterin-dependent oxidoreductase [Anaerolineae bacterium]